MNLGKISVTTAAVAAALALSACGGGGGGGSGSTEGGGGAVTGTTISGKAIDGYLKGATVCVDMNGDGACGADEPKTTTGDGGDYSLAGVTDNAKGKNLLVLIDSNTIDQARPSHTFTATTPLIRHLDKLEGKLHITPLTTMVAAEMAKGSTLNSAQEIVKTSLGIEDTNVDYTGTAAIETKAQTLVDAMQQAAASGKLDMASALAAASALTKNPGASKDEITDSIASGKEEISALEKFSQLLASGEWYDGESGKWKSTDGTIDGYIGISTFSKDKATFRSEEWNGTTWEAGTDSDYEHVLQKKGGGWVYIPRGTEETDTILARSYDAVSKKFILEQRRELSGQLFKSEIDLPQDVAGKRVADFLLAEGGNSVNPDQITNVSASLPAGSIYMTGRAIPVDPEVSVSLYEGKRCAEKPLVTTLLTDPKGVKRNVEHCNYLGEANKTYTQLDQAIGLVVDGYYKIADGKRLLSAGMPEGAPEQQVGTWDYATGLDGKQLIQLNTDGWAEPETRPVIVLNEETGLLQKGWLWLPDSKEEFAQYNKPMLEKMLSVYGTLLDRVLAMFKR